ncbi:uncharacterized protein G2W53_042035 [Senna tora]|uniref:Uncharacterized protein n=1 Tax=Senna tora TaxID=362788 RepID=A0A834W3G2_9FABA|nr:uncharacterized protein G2W53_042035 [Senna tora]
MGEEKNTGKREMGFLPTARKNGGDGGSGCYCERMACCGYGSKEREGRRRAKTMVVRWWREQKTPEMKVNVNGGNGGGWRLMVASVERGEEEGKWVTNHSLPRVKL